MKSKFLFFCLLCITPLAYSQLGGEVTYPFLRIPTSARMAGLGGAPASIIDNDVNLAIANPALLSDTMNLAIALNYSPYLVGTKNSFFGFAKSWKGVGNFLLGINNLSYGTFDGFDEFGTQSGTFTGHDMAIYMQYSRRLSPSFSSGITIKPIFTEYESYSSSALATDIAFNYNNLSRLFSAGIILRNYGRQFSNYGNNKTESFTPDLAISVSQKLKHAPLRFLLTAQNLTKWDLTYNVVDKGNSSAISIQEPTTYSFGNKLLRHVVIGVEIIPTRNIYVDISYNGRIQQELKYETSSTFAGFAFGFGFRVKQFQFGYAIQQYHSSSSAHFFSISTNFGRFAFAQRK